MNVIYEDFFAGFAIAQITALVWGVWSLAVGVVSGILWVGGGQGWLKTKAWRRIGVPMAVCLPFALSEHLLDFVISFPLQCGVQCIGYGVPDINDSEGSWLGRRFGKWARIVWFLLMGLSLVPLLP